VFQNSRCALSGAPLELPAVHFLCGHSFNARALSEGERECPLCAPQFRTILDIRRSLRAGAAEQARARPLAPPGRRLARHAYTLLFVCLLCEKVKQREAWVCRQAGRTMMAPPVPAERWGAELALLDWGLPLEAGVRLYSVRGAEGQRCARAG